MKKNKRFGGKECIVMVKIKEKNTSGEKSGKEKIINKRPHLEHEKYLKNDFKNHGIISNMVK
jgi:hypothetical protein